MNLKKILIALAFVGMAIPGFAQAEGNYLHVKTADGWKVLNLDKVDRLTFKGGNMTASDKDNNVVETVPMASLETITFSEQAEPSSVASIEADTAAPFSFDAASSTVHMNADGDFSLYDIEGKLLVSIPAVKAGETIDLSAVKGEVVVIKSGNHSLKTILKR